MQVFEVSIRVRQVNARITGVYCSTQFTRQAVEFTISEPDMVRLGPWANLPVFVIQIEVIDFSEE